MGVRVVFPDMGKDPSVQLIEKTITQNGTYDAIADGANGYSKVNVNVEGGGGSSDFSVKSLTIVNGDTDTIDVPLIPCFGDKTVYKKEGLTISPVELGDTLYTKNSGSDGINVGESLTFNILTYQNKVLLAKIASLFEITPNNGCTVEMYFPEAEEGDALALITFTADNATITLKYQ